jgi:hypothetical protein
MKIEGIVFQMYYRAFPIAHELAHTFMQEARALITTTTTTYIQEAGRVTRFRLYECGDVAEPLKWAQKRRLGTHSIAPYGEDGAAHTHGQSGRLHGTGGWGREGRRSTESTMSVSAPSLHPNLALAVISIICISNHSAVPSFPVV